MIMADKRQERRQEDWGMKVGEEKAIRGEENEESGTDALPSNLHF